MAFKYKGLVKCSLAFFLIIASGYKSLCSIEEEQVQMFQNNDNQTKNTLGNYCWRGRCSEGQICSEIFKCECCPGFINRSDVCVPCAGENEECFTSHDCCGMLFCINGICRKATPDADFITLAKVCLGITVVSVIIALLSFSLKCLLRLDNSQIFSRCRNSQGANSENIRQVRRVLESQTPPIRIDEEKPPTYEECMRQGQRSSLADPPPTYVSSNNFTTSNRNCVFSVENITEITPPNNLILNTPERFSKE